MRKISFREALKILVNGGHVVVKSKAYQDDGLLIQMVDDKGNLKASDGITYKINELSDDNDIFYEVNEDCIYLDVKVTYKNYQKINKYIILPEDKQKNVTIIISDLKINDDK